MRPSSTTAASASGARHGHVLAALAVACLGALALIGAFALAGCAGGPPTDVPDISGTVSSVDRGTDGALSMLVKADGAGSYDQAAVYVTSGTTVERADGSEVPADEIVTGSLVDVWFTGPVRESYPVQADAEFVVLR